MSIHNVFFFMKNCDKKYQLLFIICFSVTDLGHVEHTDGHWFSFLCWGTAGEHGGKPTGTLG